MSTITKFYLHRGTTAVSGTLPGAGSSISATAPTQIASGVNRSMDAAISTSAQTSQVLTCLANTSAQPSLMLRFLSAPIGAQTIPQQDLSVSYSGLESNTNSLFRPNFSLCVWRPSTGAIVGRIGDLSAGVVNFNATTQQNKFQTIVSAGTTATTSADGDVLVLELWRDTAPQGMGTAYTNTMFYDGTTEASATNDAAYLLFITAVTMSSGVVATAPKPPRIVGNSAALTRSYNW